jgi:HSF-type DNA-binding
LFVAVVASLRAELGFSVAVLFLPGKSSHIPAQVAPEVTHNTKPADAVSLRLPRKEAKAKRADEAADKASFAASSGRLNKFVRRLYDMLQAESESGIVEWRRGLLILHNTNVFAKQILPKYFNTRNFKTFRRQLNYYGFVHVRSFSNIGSAATDGSLSSTATATSTSALWVNRELAARCVAGGPDASTDSMASVLLLKRVEPCKAAKTVEGRRVRKELARTTVEEDLGVSSVKSMLWLPEIRSPTSSSSAQRTRRTEQCDSMDYRENRTVNVVVEHHNYAPSTVSEPEQHSDLAMSISNITVNNSDESSDEESMSSSPPPQPHVPSSVSVANLLLLLSKV